MTQTDTTAIFFSRICPDENVKAYIPDMPELVSDPPAVLVDLQKYKTDKEAYAFLGADSTATEFLDNVVQEQGDQEKIQTIFITGSAYIVTKFTNASEDEVDKIILAAIESLPGNEGTALKPLETTAQTAGASTKF
jgi:hypothetical protein